MKTIIIIHNLNSRGKNINEDYVRELLNKKGMKFHYFQTKRISDVDEIIKKYNNPSEFQYCSIGGDGSLNALVNSLLKNDIIMPEVSCLPGGSGSDFIRTFALPQNIEQAVEHLNYDNFYEVDVGLIRNKTDAKYFINILNIGFLASTVEISEKFPNLFRAFRYPLSFWIKIITARAKEMTISNDKYEFKGMAFIFAYAMHNILEVDGIYLQNLVCKMVCLIYRYLQSPNLKQCRYFFLLKKVCI